MSAFFGLKNKGGRLLSRPFNLEFIEIYGHE
jgi:hypothetical protein